MATAAFSALARTQSRGLLATSKTASRYFPRQFSLIACETHRTSIKLSSAQPKRTMTSVIASATQAAHSAAASLLSTAQIKVGDAVPTIEVKEDSPTSPAPLNLNGKTIILLVPGAYTGTCHAQVPGYVKHLDQFKAKGVSEVYVVAVNDVFVMKSWKDNLAPGGTAVHFIADDKGAFASASGLIFDASPLLGSPRAKRAVIIADNGKVTHLVVEEDPGKLTNTAADKILALL